MKTIFLSATAPRSSQGNTPRDELLDYVATGEVTGELSARLASAVADVLDDKRWRLEYMILEVRDQLSFDRGVLEGLADGIRRGREQGHAQGMIEGHKQGVKLGHKQGLAEGMIEGRKQGVEEGLAKGREQGVEEGLARGREQGVGEGEDRLSRLIATLIDARKMDLVAAVASDKELRTELYERFGID